MADIDVVPKHRSYAWVWILLAIAVIALLIWAFAGRNPAATQLLPDTAGPAAGPVTAGAQPLIIV
jgi:hypothetical protein